MEAVADRVCSDADVGSGAGRSARDIGIAEPVSPPLASRSPDGPGGCRDLDSVAVDLAAPIDVGRRHLCPRFPPRLRHTENSRCARRARRGADGVHTRCATGPHGHRHPCPDRRVQPFSHRRVAGDGTGTGAHVPVDQHLRRRGHRRPGRNRTARHRARWFPRPGVLTERQLVRRPGVGGRVDGARQLLRRRPRR